MQFTKRDYSFPIESYSQQKLTIAELTIFHFSENFKSFLTFYGSVSTYLLTYAIFRVKHRFADRLRAFGCPVQFSYLVPKNLSRSMSLNLYSNVYVINEIDRLPRSRYTFWTCHSVDNYTIDYFLIEKVIFIFVISLLYTV